MDNRPKPLPVTIRLVASWFGLGLVLRRWRGDDSGSGTVGALGALVLALALGLIGWEAQLVAAGLVTGLSMWACGRAARGSGEEDPGWVVVDEAAGTFIATIGVSSGAALVGFVVFRVADITKRFPLIRRAESLPGGVGITADDVVAGLWGLAAAWVVQILVF
ncbi:MAG: phosphatidylglycerophosphatase A [bacterium]|nr:phosphatidylglycerophosphatase A [bacterium]MDE0643152.1 phosphatidylglycerophosphatase A [bacterium]